jgi:putative transposase
VDAMPKSRFSPHQIRIVLQDLDAGRSAKDVSRQYGVSVQTIYRWRASSGEGSTHMKEQLRSLQMENRRLKSKFAELVLDYTSLRAALMKNVDREC